MTSRCPKKIVWGDGWLLSSSFQICHEILGVALILQMRLKIGKVGGFLVVARFVNMTFAVVAFYQPNITFVAGLEVVIRKSLTKTSQTLSEELWNRRLEKISDCFQIG